MNRIHWTPSRYVYADSPIFNQWTGESELRGATPGFSTERMVGSFFLWPPREIGYSQISPSFRIEDYQSDPLRGFQVLQRRSSYGYFSWLLLLYPDFFGSRRTTLSRISCLLSCVAIRLVPRFFSTGASIVVARSSTFFRALLHAHGLELGSFFLVTTLRSIDCD